MYTAKMKKSLEENKKFIKSLSESQIESLMKEFDKYEIKTNFKK